MFAEIIINMLGYRDKMYISWNVKQNEFWNKIALPQKITYLTKSGHGNLQRIVLLYTTAKNIELNVA